MKKIFLIGLSSLVLFIATVSAQQASYHYHRGTNNKFPIGNKDVLSTVYLQFLKDKATGEEYSYWHVSKYRELSFMDTTWYGSNMSCIKRMNAWSPEKKSYYYDYSLIPGHGHEDYIIDALNSEEVQQEFNVWCTEWLKDSIKDQDPTNDFSNVSPSPASSL
ncbi:MAG: hypothetical protein WCO92_02670 [Verrucomicrobiota bacterium]